MIYLNLKEITTKAGLQGHYTNHSGKRSLATQLYSAGVPEQEIMSRTGHRSEMAVRKYKRPSEKILQEVSDVLNPPVKKEKYDAMDVDSDVKCPKVGENPVCTPFRFKDLTNFQHPSVFNNCTFHF